MSSDPKGAYTILAILLAWLGYRAGARTQRVSSTWSDHRDARTKANLLGRLRWTHLGWAIIGWAVLIVGTMIAIKS